MLANREGHFKAIILDHGVNESGPNKLVTFAAQFKLVGELVNGDWMAVDENLTINGYFYIEKKDGSLNTNTIESLKEALGWDGRDPMWLQDTPFSEKVVQLSLGFEEWQGKQRLKVKYINSEDWAGAGVAKADDATRRTVSTKLGSKLRANAGGTPANAPKPSTAKPQAPKAPPKPQPQQPPAAAPKDADAAWEAFKAHFKPGVTPKLIEDNWFRILEETFPGRDPATLHAAEWAKFTQEAPAKIIPF